MSGLNEVDPRLRGGDDTGDFSFHKAGLRPISALKCMTRGLFINPPGMERAYLTHSVIHASYFGIFGTSPLGSVEPRTGALSSAGEASRRGIAVQSQAE